MGFKLGEDVLGVLSHNTGVITMAPSLVTVGGQQYRTGTLIRTIATDVTMAASTLYIVFAVLNSGNVELRISANMNSIGPAGFSAWTIVGAFYSNNAGTVAFSSFVNITGVPRSDWSTAVPITITSTGGGVVKGATPTTDSIRSMRMGSDAECELSFRNANVGTAGAGDYKFLLPDLLASTSAYAFYATILATAVAQPTNVIGFGTASLTAPNLNQAQISLFDSTNFRILMTAGASNGCVGATVYSQANNGVIYTAKFRFAVSGWSNTQLKDL